MTDPFIESLFGSVSDRAKAADGPFRILVVCTANVARSPYLERRLQSDLDTVCFGRFSVSSAGTHAEHRARRMARGSLAMLDRHEIVGDGFLSRQLEPGFTRRADLIVTMSERHSREVLAVEPSVLGRLFTVSELETLAAGAVAQGSSRDKVSFAHRCRADARRRAPQTDVADPYGKDTADYEAMAVRLDAVSARISEWLVTL